MKLPDRDQDATRKALAQLRILKSRYPDSSYAQKADNKIRLCEDTLAAQEMNVGRYYMDKNNHVAAINRFKTVVTDYQTTAHVEEALYRLTVAYLSLGIAPEAQNAAAVLGHNFPNSSWYKESYALLNKQGLMPQVSQGSWMTDVLQGPAKAPAAPPVAKKPVPASPAAPDWTAATTTPKGPVAALLARRPAARSCAMRAVRCPNLCARWRPGLRLGSLRLILIAEAAMPGRAEPDERQGHKRRSRRGAEAGRGRGRAAPPGRAHPPSRRTVLPAGRAGGLRCRIRRLAPAQRGDRGAFPQARASRQPLATRRSRAGRRLRQGTPSGADAVARQCLRRRGRDRLRRARASLPEARCRGAAGVHRRAEDRRAVDLAALRKRRAHRGGNARRRHGRARTSPAT